MRVFDRVHGEVDLHPLLARIVNTPEFNRLDGIRQLGTCAMLYPSATHTRLEHAIGVSHLATVLCKRLQSQHPELISEDDILCTGLAGLVHDLGHGPFSHAFENYMRSQGYRWNHEEAGLEVLTHLLEMNEIRLGYYFEGNCAEVIERVRGMVLGTDTGTQKEFLYEIVHARKTGIDVDAGLPRARLAGGFGTHTVDFKRMLYRAKSLKGVWPMTNAWHSMSQTCTECVRVFIGASTSIARLCVRNRYFASSCAHWMLACRQKNA